MINKLLNLSHNPGVIAKLENILLVGFNIMNIGMIDWVRGIGSIMESFPAIALTLTMCILNLAKAYQIIIEAIDKRKKRNEDNLKD